MIIKSKIYTLSNIADINKCINIINSHIFYTLIDNCEILKITLIIVS